MERISSVTRERSVGVDGIGRKSRRIRRHVCAIYARGFALRWLAKDQTVGRMYISCICVSWNKKAIGYTLLMIRELKLIIINVGTFLVNDRSSREKSKS